MAEVKDRLSGLAKITDAELADVLAGEVELQAAVCLIPLPDPAGVIDTFPVALRNALFRRVARALEMKKNPLAVLRGDGDGIGPAYLPGNDPEVRRLEGPYRRVVFA